jgi:hypothetical protein
MQQRQSLSDAAAHALRINGLLCRAYVRDPVTRRRAATYYVARDRKDFEQWRLCFSRAEVIYDHRR